MTLSTPVSSKRKKACVYTCTYCDKKFDRPSALKTHVFSHTKEKPYQCSNAACGRKFSVVSKLRRHMKLHERENSTNENCIKISAKERIYRIRQLVSKKHFSPAASPTIYELDILAFLDSFTFTDNLN